MQAFGEAGLGVNGGEDILDDEVERRRGGGVGWYEPLGESSVRRREDVGTGSEMTVLKKAILTSQRDEIRGSRVKAAAGQ